MAGALEAVDQAGNACRMNLQPLSHFAQWHGTATAEEEIMSASYRGKVSSYGFRATFKRLIRICLRPHD